MADARVFGVYEGAQVGAGHKSMAVKVRMRAADHTLSADEVLGACGSPWSRRRARALGRS